MPNGNGSGTASSGVTPPTSGGTSVVLNDSQGGTSGSQGGSASSGPTGGGGGSGVTTGNAQNLASGAATMEDRMRALEEQLAEARAFNQNMVHDLQAQLAQSQAEYRALNSRLEQVLAMLAGNVHSSGGSGAVVMISSPQANGTEPVNGPAVQGSSQAIVSGYQGVGATFSSPAQ